MQPGRQEVVSITQDVWQTALGIDLDPVVAPDVSPSDVPTLDGVIAITGDWFGAVVVQVPIGLADRAARVMFALEDQPASTQDMQDAVGEITNMTGGNLKGLLDGRCHLGLPTVVAGTDHRLSMPASAQVVTRVAFQSGDDRAIVTLVAGPAELA
ncbi:MAG: chemotaxis protein CheX [Acidobacteria bacterium]|nr:chemotaxis protein CheX [Acidobacteriota bacterium]